MKESQAEQSPPPSAASDRQTQVREAVRQTIRDWTATKYRFATDSSMDLERAVLAALAPFLSQPSLLETNRTPKDLKDLPPIESFRGLLSSDEPTPTPAGEDTALFPKDGTLFLRDAGKLAPENRRYIHLDSGRHAHLIFVWIYYDRETRKNIYRLSNIITGEMS